MTTPVITYREAARELMDRARVELDAGDLVERDDSGRPTACNLDLKNPHAGETIDPRPPQEIVESIIQKERRILEIMEEIKAELAEDE